MTARSVVGDLPEPIASRCAGWWHGVVRNPLLPREIAVNTPHNPVPVARTISDTSKAYGWTRTFIYERLGIGDLQAVKAGRRTLILTATADALFCKLPPAAIRAPRKHAA